MVMKVLELPEEIVARIKRRRYDSIIEKHEGPWTWDWILEYCEFLNLDNHQVLLPVDREHHPNILLLRCIASADNRSLTLFLADTTYDEDVFSGRMAVCDKFEDEDFYLALLYHEWFITDGPLWEGEVTGDAS